MAFTRTTTINAAPGGDSVKQAVLDLDADLTGAFTHLNTLETADSTHAALTAAHGVTGAVVGTTNTQTLTNKTISLANNTVSGTLAQFNAAVSDADILDTATAASTYAPIANGVTNGDSHDHSGGDGAAISLTAAVTGILPVASGGTGSSTQNFVDLTSNQTIGGVKTFTSDMQVNGLQVGGRTKTVGLQVVDNISSEGFSITPDAYGNTVLSSYYEGYQSFAIAGTERMRITHTGNLLVGIPTDDGISKLRVLGSGLFQWSDSNSVTGGQLRLKNLNGGTRMSLFVNQTDNTVGFVAGGSLVNPAFTWRQNDGTLELMRLTASGSLLVGTTTDDGVNKLQVAGGIAFAPSTTTTAPAAGGAGALPATPLGYATITINGTARKVAYYA